MSLLATPQATTVQRNGDRSLGTPEDLLFLTVLFSDLAGSVGLSQRMNWAAYVDLLKIFRQLCKEVVAAHGGQIARTQGDGALVFFGLYGPSYDDGRRAVACALELHARVREIEVDNPSRRLTRIALHSGIHAGLTYLEHGDVERGRFDLLGNTPNLAARLCSMAGRDGIYASEQALRAHSGAFSTEGRVLLRPRGWGAPVPAYSVIGHAQPARRGMAAVHMFPPLEPVPSNFYLPGDAQLGKATL